MERKGPGRVGIDEFGLMTLDDVAALLRCSKGHVANIVAGRVRGCPPIPAVRLGRRRLVRRSSLEAWIMANDQVATNDNTQRHAANDNARMMASPERGRRSA
jgi:excisionase family DNA binding protein